MEKISDEQIKSYLKNFAKKIFKYEHIISNSNRMNFRYEQENCSETNFDIKGLGLYVSVYKESITIGYHNVMPTCTLYSGTDGTIVLENPRVMPEETFYYVLFQFIVSFSAIAESKICEDNQTIKVKFSEK